MAPTQPNTAQRPREESGVKDAPEPPLTKHWLPVQPGDEVVISGIAGQFPDSDNIIQLKESLLRGQDLVTADDRRWKLDHPEIPPRSGKINNLEKFDASFFGVHYKQAHTMDPMCRLLLERSYEAVIDAGVNPRTMRGKRVGVFVGACFSESEKTWFYEKLQLSGFGITGCSRAMLANRVSYWLGAKGPTFSLDSACSSSLYAFQQAYDAMRAGQIDAAIVGGTNLVLHPYLSLQFMRLGVLSRQGVCKPFDEEANGYVRSEAVVAVFLQRAKDARRIYATVVNAGVNSDGYKEQGITYPSGQAQAELMRETCKEAGIDPSSLAYVEAHATGTRVGDPEELTALDEVFCKEPGRKGPLLVGSVKSNIGHTEPASGLCSIAKVIIAMEEQVIPPTIHYKRTRRVPGLCEGRLKVVTEPTSWSGGIVAVNSFGFGGANAHVLLRSPAERAPSLREREQGGVGTSPPLPRLLLVSARTSEGAEVLLAEAARHSPPHEGLVNLLHAIHEENIPGHIYRAFAVAGADADTKLQVNDVQYWSGEKRPVWFVFAGMGSQWAGMGSALMRLPVFAAAIQRCHAVLAPKGIDIVNVITSQDPKVLEDILNCFVGIAAVQIGLVDILREVGIEPDFIIGHSVGELGCAYADGCLTAEQTVLAAYSRGRASLDAKLIPGAMAAVGMGAAQLSLLCPPDVDIACQNSADSSTISGPAHSLRAFVETLKAKGIFAKEVPCANIAYHSRYIKPAGELLIKYLKEVIPFPRKRSQRWLSSSVPEGMWETEEAKFCSAEYQTNNLLRSVLFEQVLNHIPSHAIAIEIAPHGLLQAILKRALPTEVLNVPLARRGTDSLLHVLGAIGRLYTAGLQPRPAALYPPPQWPVPRGTPMLSPLVKWAHEDDWFVTTYRLREKAHSAERCVNLSPQEEDNEMMDGHIIDGRALVPATGYLKLVWQMVSDLEGKLISETSVVFEDVRFYRATHLPKEEGEMLELMVMIHRGSGAWEVSDRGTTVAAGRVHLVENSAKEFTQLPPAEPHVWRLAPTDVEAQKAARVVAAAELKAIRESNPYYFEKEGEEEELEDEEELKVGEPAVGEDVPDFDMGAKHVYKCLKLRGYNYQGLFRGIASASPDGHFARIRWNSNWVSFLDAMLQVRILAKESTQLYVPTSIQKIVVDSPKFLEHIEKLPMGNRFVDVRVIPEMDVVATNHVEIRGLFATPIARRRTLADPVLERYEFVPFSPDEGPQAEGEQWEEAAGTRVCVQLSLENRAPITRTSPPVRVAELLGAARRSLMPHILGALSDLPLVQARATVFLEPGAEVDEESLGTAVTSEAQNLPGERDIAILVLNTGAGGTISPEALLAASNALLPGGALFVVHPASAGSITALRTAAANTGLQLAMRLRLCGGDMLLHFRKGGWQVNPNQLKVVRVPELATEDPNCVEAFAWIEDLKEALKDPNPAEKRVVLIARGALNGALGLFNCLRQEPGAGSHLTRLYLLPEETDAENATLDVLGDMGLRERLELDLAVNVFQGGRWGSMRHHKLPSEPTVPVRHAFVNTIVPGDLSSLTWLQGRIDVDSTARLEDMERVHVHYAALNFRDIMIASGKLNVDILPQSDLDSQLGFEFSGRLDDGRRVMGMRMGGGISTEIEAPRITMWNIPENMTMQEAATIPAAYATVVFALDMVGHMAAGESVLVHAASGAVGQAAITLALARGCRVFATVGTPEKKAFLLRTFPQLDENDIGNSRDLSFEYMILHRTNGKGVHLILNSLAEDKLQASLRCLGEHGRFLEIGKVDMVNNSAIGMRMLLKQTSIHGILIDSVLADLKDSRTLELLERIHKLIEDGTVRPIKTQVFNKNQVQEAFRLMAAGKHIGKVVIAVREGEPEFGTIPSKPVIMPASPRFYCKPDASYVISGGLGGLGVELAHWLVQRGARALVLVSRRGVSSGYQARRLRQWRAAGVRVLVRTDDTATAAGAEALLRAANALAPVHAIFNLAVVLRDALFANQSPEAFRESFRCKASAAVRLDAASRRLCPRLRHFVLFSSVSCGRGNAGQTNYGFANSVMERVARGRREKGLPATAVQWGAVGDVGLVADMRDDDKILEIGGTLQQKLTNCLDVLDGFMAQDNPVVASMVVAEKRAGAGADDLVSAIATLLGFRDLKTVSHESSLAELGMDSMMAVEIQQALARDFDVLLAPQDVRALTFGRLKEIQREKAAKEKQSRAAPVAAAEMAGTAGAEGAQAPLDERARTLAQGQRALATEGLRQMVRAIGDELTAAQPLVPLVSAAPDARGVVLMFPGVEGVAPPLEPLARGFTRRAVALQLPFGDVEPSVSAIVDVLMPYVLASCNQTEQIDATEEGFILLGYSYGGLLALEAAARLEANRGTNAGHLVLLDSSPILMREMAKILVTADAGGTRSKKELEITDIDEERLQEELLVHLLSNFYQDQSPQEILANIRSHYSELTTWESRLEIFVRMSPDTGHSNKYKMAAIDSFYRRILSALSYEWPKDRPKIQSTVTLIRPSVPAIPPGFLPEDYGLSTICARPVRVLYVDNADHYTLPTKRQTSVLVNTALDEAQKELNSSLKQFIISPEINVYHGLKSLYK